jgi:hypothetical protein
MRAPVDVDGLRVGAGDTPRFALYAAGGDGGSQLIARYSGLLEPALREPFHQDGLWLVRPDGYVALATRPNRWDEVARYFGFFCGDDYAGGYFVLGFEVEELDALDAAAGGANGFGVDADDLAELADDHELDGLVDEVDAGYLAGQEDWPSC